MIGTLDKTLQRRVYKDTGLLWESPPFALGDLLFGLFYKETTFEGTKIALQTTKLVILKVLLAFSKEKLQTFPDLIGILGGLTEEGPHFITAFKGLFGSKKL